MRHELTTVEITMKKAFLLATALTFTFAATAPASADPAPITLGDNGSGNVCDGTNWIIVGFSSYEECIAVFGPATSPVGDPNAGSIPVPPDLVCVPDFASNIPGANGCD
jgi:hypothetical protein